MQSFLITDPIVAKRTGWKDIPAEIRHTVYAYASARGRIAWQRTCRLMDRDLPGLHMPEAFKAVYEDPSSNWIHKELVVHTLKHGPRWVDKILSVERDASCGINLKFRICRPFRQYRCHLRLQMTLNPAPHVYRKIIHCYGKPSQGSFLELVNPPNARGSNIQWTFHYNSFNGVWSWSWSDIEKQLPCIPWKAIHREPVIEEYSQNLIFARATHGAVPGGNMDVILPGYMG
jgi:hypothetical protein